MNAPFDLRLSKAEFDRWLLGQEYKHEWKEGRVVQMTNVTRGHASIVMNIAIAMTTRLDRAQWLVVASDFGVEDETYVRFPDVLVEPTGGDAKERRSANATLLFEVLSPSSVDTDLIEKPEEYLTIATLEAYVVVSQDAAICWIWARDGSTKAFPSKPVKIVGREQSLELSFFATTLPLAEIYRGIETGE